METFLVFLLFLLPLTIFVIIGTFISRISKQLKILEAKYHKIEGYLEGINYIKQSHG